MISFYDRQRRSAHASPLHASIPVDQDLANLDALTAGTQSILECFATPDDTDATQLLGKIYANIGTACGSDDAPLGERQVAQPGFHHLHATTKGQNRPCRMLRGRASSCCRGGSNWRVIA